MTTNFGALPGEWDHLSLLLGLTGDLLPVVSDPAAKISAQSTMASLGKTPSLFNRQGEVVGISGWTQRVSTPDEISKWSRDPRLGICLQTRSVRAFDIDIEDPLLAQQVSDALLTLTGPLPCRTRPNSAKRLFLFQSPGEIPKRVIRLPVGIIEMLATGQQCVVSGTHPSGARYEWLGGLPEGIPTLSLTQVDQVWEHLAHEFSGSATIQTATPSRANVLKATIENDPIAKHLLDTGWVKQTTKEGPLHITCPFESDHTSESAVSATTYFPPNTGGYQFGHFKCLHAHCEHRTDDEFKQALGIPYEDPFDDFDVVQSSAKSDSAPVESGTPPKKPRFTVTPASEFAVAQRAGWLVKGVIPKAELVVVYGESGSGKSFLVNDIAYAVAQGTPWRGHRVNQGSVVIIAAEGANGMRGRLIAYSIKTGVDLATLPLGVIADAPNFMQVQDVKDVILSVRAFGDVSMVVVDTFAQVMAGSNENAGEDVGKALAHCRQIHKHTGATVVLIHHAGKDASKGARGWSGLRAAADAEIEVSRCDDDRVATITKMKDGQDGLEFGFKLHTVIIGMDEDDEGITSCVIEHVEGGARKAIRKQQGANEKLVLRCLDDLVSVGDERVDFTTLINEAMRQMTPPVMGKRDRRGELAKRALDALRESGDVTIDNGFISRVGETE